MSTVFDPSHGFLVRRAPGTPSPSGGQMTTVSTTGFRLPAGICFRDCRYLATSAGWTYPDSVTKASRVSMPSAIREISDSRMPFILAW